MYAAASAAQRRDRGKTRKGKMVQQSREGGILAAGISTPWHLCPAAQYRLYRQTEVAGCPGSGSTDRHFYLLGHRGKDESLCYRTFHLKRPSERCLIPRVPAALKPKGAARLMRQ